MGQAFDEMAGPERYSIPSSCRQLGTVFTETVSKNVCDEA